MFTFIINCLTFVFLPQSLGFIDADRLAEIMCATPIVDVCKEPPDIQKVLHDLQLSLQEEKGYAVSSVSSKSTSRKGKKKNSQSTRPLHHQQEAENPQSDTHVQHTTSGNISYTEPVRPHSVTPMPSSNTSSMPAPATAQSAHTSADMTSLVLELQILFPNKTETDLQQALIDSNYNTDVAVSNIFAEDSLANARSANGHNS